MSNFQKILFQNKEFFDSKSKTADYKASSVKYELVSCRKFAKINDSSVH
jgi:hypothetical protein